MPLQFGVQKRIAEPQRVGVAPLEEVGFALKTHGVGRDPFAESGPGQFHADAGGAAEQTEPGSTFLAASVRGGCLPSSGGKTLPKVK